MGYFQEAFGYECVDAGIVAGTLGEDLNGSILLSLGKEHIWPLEDRIEYFSEDDLFDVIEFLYDNVSKPVDGHYHSFANCGTHYSTFNGPEGQAEFRSALNPVLKIYSDGFELSGRGEILHLPAPGMASLMDARLTDHDPHNVEQRVYAATDRFRRHGASLDDRKHALRDLADVLEYLRPNLKKILSSKDEGDLFNLANNFGIRHHNDRQQTDYDRSVWYDWMFYYYLATIHAFTKLSQKHAADSAE